MATNAAPPRQLSQKETDIQMMLAAEVHLGTKNCDFQMERYVFKRRTDGIPHFTFSYRYFLYLLPVLSALVCSEYSALVFFFPPSEQRIFDIIR